MMPRTVPISARISQEDAEFLSQLTIAQAITPSDKLRAIISEARERHAVAKDYRGCYQTMQGWVQPAQEKIRQAELDNHIHSELVQRTAEWLPDTVAYLVSVMGDDEEITREQLKQLEAGLADRVFRLVESVLQLGITQRGPCYDPSIVAKRLGPALELSSVIISRQK